MGTARRSHLASPGEQTMPMKGAGAIRPPGFAAARAAGRDPDADPIADPVADPVTAANVDAHPVLSIVVPMFDEEDNVLPLATQVQAAMAASPWPWELILVDDGSGDRTSERIREAVASSPDRVAAVLLRRRFGQTAAMQAGIDRARGSVVATMDGDL